MTPWIDLSHPSAFVSSWCRHGFQWVSTHLDDFDSEIDQVVDGVLLRDGQSRMLIKSPSVLVGDSVSEENVQGNDSDFVQGSVDVSHSIRAQSLSGESPT